MGGSSSPKLPALLSEKRPARVVFPGGAASGSYGPFIDRDIRALLLSPRRRHYLAQRRHCFFLSNHHLPLPTSGMRSAARIIAARAAIPDLRGQESWAALALWSAVNHPLGSAITPP